MVAGSELRRGHQIGPPSVSPRIFRFLSRQRTEPGKGGTLFPAFYGAGAPSSPFFLTVLLLFFLLRAVMFQVGTFS